LENTIRNYYQGQFIDFVYLALNSLETIKLLEELCKLYLKYSNIDRYLRFNNSKNILNTIKKRCELIFYLKSIKIFFKY